MLIQFAVENVLSFRDQTVLSLAASPDPKHPGHQLPMLGPDDLSTLRCAAVYGANASGKSNLVKALALAQQLVTQGTRPAAAIQVVPFRLSDQPLPNSRFEFEIYTQHTRYSYGFVVSTREVKQEWLYRTEATAAAEQLCFEREAAPDGIVQIKLGPLFGATLPRVQFVAEGTRPNQLFLTEAEERNVPELKPVSGWFRDQLILIYPESFFARLADLAELNPDFREFLGTYLRDAGTGITGLTTKRKPLKNLLDAEQEKIRAYLDKHGESGAQIERSSRLRIDVVRAAEDAPLEEVQLRTQRTLPSGGTVLFRREAESDGTNRLLELATLLWDRREQQALLPQVYVVDELERSLHPLLTRQLLQNFLGNTAGHNQLLFTTHDTNLLDLDLLRADEIWFAEKGPDHASRLYSLAEFKEEQLQHLGSHLEKGYLNGRFGAIPFLGQPRQLGLERKE